MDVQLEKLVRMQQVDSRAAQLLEAIAGLPKRLESLEDQLRRSKQTVEQAEKAVLAEEAKRRRMESDLKDQRQKIAKYRDQSSSVKTNEQFHAQHEIGFVEAEIRRIEDAELVSMIQSESLDGQRSQAKQEIAFHGKQIEQEKEVVRREILVKRRELDTLQQERAGLRAGVAEELLAEYDRLASSSRKTALARASGHRCLGCQMALRPQFWNQVRMGTLLNCESCGRLLYFDATLEPAPEAAPGMSRG